MIFYEALHPQAKYQPKRLPWFFLYSRMAAIVSGLAKED